MTIEAHKTPAPGARDLARALLASLRLLSRDWFLVGMVGAVLLATAAPEVGRSGGRLRGDVVANVGIFAIFFLHGVGLSTEKLRAGLSRWRLHLLIQSFTFVVFPALYFAFRVVVGTLLSRDLLLGFLYLCALPSTISSSVAMTALAGGNVPAAAFNATLSSLLGVFLTPLLVSLGAPAHGTLSAGRAMAKIAVLLVVPMVIGQLARPLVGRCFDRWKPYTSVLDRAVILMLVYVAFCDSVRGGLWTDHGASLLLVVAVGAAVLLGIVLTLTRAAARRLGFPREDEIAAVFCGSKKTLASGVPMAKLLFGADPAIGVIVLPIMFYHQLQLLAGAVIANRYRAEGAQLPGAASR